jgi:hypothetical protein
MISSRSLGGVGSNNAINGLGGSSMEKGYGGRPWGAPEGW